MRKNYVFISFAIVGLSIIGTYLFLDKFDGRTILWGEIKTVGEFQNHKSDIQPDETERPMESRLVIDSGENKTFVSAKLSISKQLGMSLYVADGFELVEEEPGKVILSSVMDPSYFARIEKIDRKINTADYKNIQFDNLSTIGTVIEIEPSTLKQKSFSDSDYVFLLSHIGKDEARTDIIQVLRQFGDEKFKITLFFPIKESGEGITPIFWSMLETIE